MTCESIIDQYPVLHEIKNRSMVGYASAYGAIVNALNAGGIAVYGDSATIQGDTPEVYMYTTPSRIFTMRYDFRRLNYSEAGYNEGGDRREAFRRWCYQVAAMFIDLTEQAFFKNASRVNNLSYDPHTSEILKEYPAPNGVPDTAYVLSMQERVFQDRAPDPGVVKELTEFPWRWNLMFDKLEPFFLGVIF